MAERAAQVLLGLAAAAIAFAAADTYVVVLALPDMMTSAGLSIDELSRAAPIISGFLLGYVAFLPLIGTISDIRGRVPVLLGSLIIFAFGSLITASGHELGTIVVGRVIQGIGGGGLIPPTLALVADSWPPQRRGLPLGIVGGVQELGAVLGPLYGAFILGFGTWRDIFWLNLAVGLVLAAAIVRFGTRKTRPQRPFDVLGLALFGCSAVLLAIGLAEPPRIATDVTLGVIFLPVIDSFAWTAPVWLASAATVVALLIRLVTARHPFIDLAQWWRIGSTIDVIGAAALTLALAAVVLAFASDDPEVSALSGTAHVALPLAGVALILFLWRQRTARSPLVPHGTLRAPAAWGSLAVSFFVGAALVAALVDIPFFARLTTERESQVGAAFVLVRFLIALPIGAVVGGWLLRTFSASLLTAVAMLLSAFAFAIMATWQAEALSHTSATVILVICGLGFGIAVAPVNAALLAATASSAHGLASSLLVVARMVGMLIGISVLTMFGMRAFRNAVSELGTVAELCGGQATACAAYADAMRDAGILQLQAIFAGAAACCLLAAALAIVLLRKRATVFS